MARELGRVGVESKLLETLRHSFVLAVKVLPRFLFVDIEVLYELEEGSETSLLKDSHQPCRDKLTMKLLSVVGEKDKQEHT